MSGGSDEWLRSPAARYLMLAALTMSLVLGIGFIVVNTPARLGAGMLGERPPLSDDQSREQVIDSASEIVAAARLKDVSASSIFLSCTSLHDPPYQAVVYLNFSLPQLNSVKRIREISAAMVTDGWQQAPAMAEHFGMKLTKNGVTSTFHNNMDDPRFGTMRIYGECRNTGDHRQDDPGWTDVTDRLG